MREDEKTRVREEGEKKTNVAGLSLLLLPLSSTIPLVL
jgi:hypothetical protein